MRHGSVVEIIMGKRRGGDKPPPDEPEMEGEGDNSVEEGLEAISDEILSAIASKDSKALSMALKDFNEMCGAYESEE